MIKSQIANIYRNKNLFNTTESFMQRYNIVRLGMFHENTDRLKKELYKKDTIKKVSNWIEQWKDFTGLDTVEKVGQEIAKDNSTGKVLCSIFSVNPVKQNIGEKMVEIEFDNHEIDYISPPNGGSKSVYLLDNGTIITGLKAKPYKECRSIDYVITRNCYTFYVSQKVTCGKGGSQNNQADHLITHLKDGKQCTNDKNIYISLADGDYYTESTINAIKQYGKKDKAYFMSMDEIINFVKTF